MKRFAILVAGGEGSRMKGALPKQFLPLAGEPVLAHSLRKFQLEGVHLFLVMHADYLEYWKELSKTLANIPEHILVAGGKTRALSVAAGLAQLPNDGLVAIHDAVRPLCSQALISRLFKTAEKEGSAIPVISCKDTLRQLTVEGSKTVPRDQFRAVQTPQVFALEKLKSAFLLPDFENYTDEASLFEAAGNTVFLEEGEESNIKLTVPFDILLAEAILGSN